MHDSLKPILAMLGVILAAIMVNILMIRLSQQELVTEQLGRLALTLLLGSLLVLLVAYLWSQPVSHRPAAWVFLIGGCVVLTYPILSVTGLFRIFTSGILIYLFLPGSTGSLSAAIIAAAGLLHLVRNRNKKPPLAGR